MISLFFPSRSYLIPHSSLFVHSHLPLLRAHSHYPLPITHYALPYPHDSTPHSPFFNRNRNRNFINPPFLLAHAPHFFRIKNPYLFTLCERDDADVDEENAEEATAVAEEEEEDA
jgi:hypothetical protein